MAEITRTLARRVLASPTRSYSFSCSRRSSLGWISSGSSPISSRNSVPPFASATLPSLSPTAPVNAPLTWPNSSLSSNSRDRLGQLTVTKAFSFCGLFSCNRAGQHRFPRAAFAQQQNRGRRRRRLEAPDRATFCIAGSHVVRSVVGAIGRKTGFQFRHAAPEFAGLDDAAEHLPDLFGREGFGDVIHRAAPHGFHRRFDRGVGGEHDHLQLRIDLQQLGQQIQPASPSSFKSRNATSKWPLSSCFSAAARFPRPTVSCPTPRARPTVAGGYSPRHQ